MPLKGREKELMWKALLKEILPGPSFFITLPADIDFDEASTLDTEKGWLCGGCLHAFKGLI